MSTIYREVKIENAEQADALPAGTIAYAPVDLGMVGIRTPGAGAGAWNVTEGYDPAHYSSFVVGWVLLDPIDAREEAYEIGTMAGHVRRFRKMTAEWEERTT